MKFEIGKKYTTRFIGDSNSTFSAICTKRTAKTVTLKTDLETVSRRIKEDQNGEYVIYQNYSMSPVFRAFRTL